MSERAKYFGGFSDRDSVARQFEVGSGTGYGEKFVPAPDFPTDDEILFASYGGQAYEGDAFVLYRRDGKLFEVTGGHCSCYGLEGQWSPEETTLAALLRRNAENDWHFLRDHEATPAQFAAVLDTLTADAFTPESERTQPNPGARGERERA